MTLKLLRRRKERLVATNTGIVTTLKVIAKLTAKRTLGPRQPGDAKLLRTQARLPLGLSRRTIRPLPVFVFHTEWLTTKGTRHPLATPCVAA